ncbi:NADPH-dependent FMN reductase [Nonomuraea gerenzanensis]|uniref:Putative reductase n=1 Tax=Nonomuraea gerenzanensis TaxID=93944 RepID=A0A1M4DXT2_9ACTN|nr:NAD(P)H-dependent oxidoreductase [Nonomuraea gerenzanensis]UBU13677.1 NAD(P)H-dependent oxidoreductase [Nonomuraea gerenzanensis]SBO91344.1 putative reductase [Nonomuraea gerenzanensis]
MDKPVLQIIVASTRPGRAGRSVADWVRDKAVASGLFEVELVDLAEVRLPFLDEPHHPRLKQYVNAHTKEWSATVDRADAYVFVTPEYNHSFPGVLKNALDYLHHEWQHKPAAFVSYGGVSGGTRAVAALRHVVSTLKMVPVMEGVIIPFVPQFRDEDGALRPNEVMEAGADAMLAELARYSGVLGAMRQPTD